MKRSVIIVFLVLLTFAVAAVCAEEHQDLTITQPRDSSVKLAKLIQELVQKEFNNRRTTRRMIRQALRELTVEELSDNYYAPYHTFGRAAVDFVRSRNNGNRLLADAPVSLAGCYNECYEKYGGMFNELFTSKVERCKATCYRYYRY